MKTYFARVFARHRNLLHRLARRFLHVAWYGLALAGGLFAIVLIAARLLLPFAADKKGELEALLSRQSGYTIRIEQLDEYWDGLHPGLRLRGVSVRAADVARPAVQLAELRVSAQILPLLVGRVDIYSAILVRPRLTLERLLDGRYRISGFTPIEQPDSAQTETFMAWLFRQDRLRLEDGELQWRDRREPDNPLQLTHVNLELANSGERHRLGVAAEWPEGMCGGCIAVADIRGNPLLGEPLRGDIYLRADDVNVSRLPRAIREQLPEAMRGSFSAELWSSWRKSLPVAVSGNVSVADLRLPLSGLRTPISVKHAATSLRWEADPNGFHVTFDKLTLALHGKPWSAGALEFTRDGNRTALSIGRVELSDITAFVAGWKPERADEPLPYQETAVQWTALRPAGTIRNLRAELTGALDAPEDFTINADVENLAVAAYRRWPGMRGVSGRLWMTPDEGSLRLDMQAGEFELPSVFRAPLPIVHAAADLHWQYQVDQWVVTTDNIALGNDDIQANGRMLLRLPDDAVRSPFLALNLDFFDGHGTNAARYYPVHDLSPTTLGWMEYAFAGGTVTHGTLLFDGETREFPFTSGTGKFEIRASVRGAEYRYLKGWEPVSDVTAEVVVQGDRFIVTGQGRIGSLRARDIVVTTGDAGTVKVSANLFGPTDETLRTLREVKTAPGEGGWKQWVPPALEAVGNGALGLTLTVPVAQGETRVNGEYRFLGGGLRVAGTDIGAGNVTGAVDFDERGVRQGGVRARFLGDDMIVAISSPAPDETLASVQGRVTAAGIAPLLGPKFASHVDGSVPWEGKLLFTNGRADVSVDADVSALNVSLPAPFNRPDGFGAKKLKLRTEVSSPRQLVVGVDLDGVVAGRVRFERVNAWRLAAGRLVYYETPPRLKESVNLSGEPGLQISAQLDEFNLDDWLALRGSGSSGVPGWLARVSAGIHRLRYLDRDFGSVSIDLEHDRTAWVGGVSGASAEGQLRFESASPPHVMLDLAHLRLPAAMHKDAPVDTDPGALPWLSVRVHSLEVHDRELGALDFAARPIPLGWRIDRLVLMRPETKFEANGTWTREYGQTRSSFHAQIKSENMGKTMVALGMPDQIDNTSVDLKADLNWNSSPADIDFDSLGGSVDIGANKGRFLQLDPGAGRLFGLLDMSAITRYLTLDFSPIFGKGFAFDRIEAHVQLDRGNAYTDDLSIRGPSARLRFGGRVGLADEDFDMTLDVYPSLSDSLTIGSLVAGGPQVALWTFIVQKLFRKQIEEGTRVTYFVKGPWRKPQITRKLVEVPSGNADGAPN